MEKKTVETTKTVDSYKKPQMVAKADAKKSFTAGCPTEFPVFTSCSSANEKCYCGPLN